MRTKTILAAILFVIALGVDKAQAQAHIKAAANCVYHDDYVKNSKSKTSCVDCYCKACGDKKQQEKETKKKNEVATTKQNKATPKKKTATTTITKAKGEEVILVAPKPKIEKNTVITLSADDKKIVDISKNLGQKEELYVGYCLEANRGMCGLFSMSEPLGVIGKIFLKKNSDYTILKDNFSIKSKNAYTFFRGKSDTYRNTTFQDTGFFIIQFENKSTSGDWKDRKSILENSWVDLVDIQGNCIFNNKDIEDIIYTKEDKTFCIVKKGQGKCTEKFNPLTKALIPME